MDMQLLCFELGSVADLALDVDTQQEGGQEAQAELALPLEAEQLRCVHHLHRRCKHSMHRNVLQGSLCLPNYATYIALRQKGQQVAQHVCGAGVHQQDGGPCTWAAGTTMLIMRKSFFRPWPTSRQPASTKCRSLRYDRFAVVRYRRDCTGSRSPPTCRRIRVFENVSVTSKEGDAAGFAASEQTSAATVRSAAMSSGLPVGVLALYAVEQACQGLVQPAAASAVAGELAGDSLLFAHRWRSMRSHTVDQDTCSATGTCSMPWGCEEALDTLL